MLIVRRSWFDRRVDEDFQRIYDLDYFTKGNLERRKFMERREGAERRKAWIKVGKWVSVFNTKYKGGFYGN